MNKFEVKAIRFQAIYESKHLFVIVLTLAPFEIIIDEDYYDDVKCVSVLGRRRCKLRFGKF